MTHILRITRFTTLLASAALVAAGCKTTATSGPNSGPNGAPSVLMTGPANAATSVARNPSITATFSEPMNGATLNATSFVVMNGTTSVPGTVTYSGNTATFTPTNSLAPNTLFTATISTAVTDLAGSHLAAAKSWSFTTVASSATGPAAVNLGTAGNYVILSKSGISTTGTTAVVGDIGVSPIAATGITGFALSAPPTTFSTSLLVTGKVWAADYAVPTPANLTTAVLDMQAAYTDAAGRTSPDFTELGAGNINGLTLVPGLYKWGTGVSLPSAVTLTGGANDVWIFQIGQNLTVGNGSIVTLSGGAVAKNVFWQVAGQATLGTTANFKGIILSKTLISFNTGATLTGRALAQTAVTLNATAITHP
jgi:hypothetical protein